MVTAFTLDEYDAYNAKLLIDKLTYAINNEHSEGIVMGFEIKQFLEQCKEG